MSSKKSKKIKGATVSLQEFNSRLDSTPSNGQNVIYAPKVASGSSWAQEMEEEDTITEKEKIFLPSAPRASRLQQQMDSIPHTAPFTAHLGNISYDISEEDVTEFFQDLEIVDLRLPRDGSRLRGFGYVEFRTRDELIEALELNGQVLKGRPLRISLGAPGSNARGGQGGEDRRQGGGRYDTDDTPDDWRSGGGNVVDSLRPDAFSGGENRRWGTGGGGRPEEFGGRSEMRPFGRNMHDDRGFEDRRGYGRGLNGSGRIMSNENMQGPPSQYPPRDRRFEDRRGGGGGGRFETEDAPDWRFGGGQVVDSIRQDSYGDDRRSWGGSGGFGRSNNDRPNDYGRSNDFVRPNEYARPNDYGRSNDYNRQNDYGRQQEHGRPNDFGNRGEMRPVRQHVQERSGLHEERSSGGFEERRGSGSGRSGSGRSESSETSTSQPQQPSRERKKLVLAPRTKPIVDEPAPESSSSIFGGAKPVDTAAREREIEEKLMNMERMHITPKGDDVRKKSVDEESNLSSKSEKEKL